MTEWFCNYYLNATQLVDKCISYLFLYSIVPNTLKATHICFLTVNLGQGSGHGIAYLCFRVAQGYSWGVDWAKVSSERSVRKGSTFYSHSSWQHLVPCRCRIHGSFLLQRQQWREKDSRDSRLAKESEYTMWCNLCYILLDISKYRSTTLKGKELHKNINTRKGSWGHL